MDKTTARHCRDQLVEIIKKRSLRYGDFTLKSGQKALFYLDLRTVTISSDVGLIVPLLADAISPLSYDAIGGPSLGADPIVGAYLGWLYPIDRRGFLVRKEEKDHGVGGLVIGSVRPGDKCVVVEDVTTTAGSLVKAVHAVREFGGEVVKAITVVDRSPVTAECSEARNWLERRENVPFSSILTIDDFDLDANQKISLQYLEQAIDLASRVPLVGEPWSWTERGSIQGILNVIQEFSTTSNESMHHITSCLDFWYKNGDVYKISIGTDIFKKEG